MNKTAWMILATLLVSNQGAAIAQPSHESINSDANSRNYPIGQDYSKLQVFIDSNGEIDFQSDTLERLFGNLYQAETLPIYKAFFLNNKNITVNDHNQLNALALEANQFNQNIQTLHNLNGAAKRFDLTNFNKAISVKYLNKVSGILDLISTSSQSKDYVSLAALIEPANAFTLQKAIINYNEEARSILGNASSIYVDPYTSQTNNVMSNYAANVLTSSDGISFGNIKPEMAPNSGSKVFVIRDDIYTFWNNSSALSYVLLNAINVNAQFEENYTITQRESVDPQLAAYVAGHDLPFSFVNEPLSAETHSAYYANIEKGNPHACADIEAFIKQGGDLYVYHDHTDYADGDYGALQGTCVPRLVAQYYDINLNTRRDTYAREYSVNLNTAPYTYAHGIQGQPDQQSPALGGSYDGEMYDANVMSGDKHQPIVSSLQLLVNAGIDDQLSSLQDAFLTAYREQNAQNYYLALIQIHKVLDNIAYVDPTLEHRGHNIHLTNNVFNYSLYEYSVNGGLSYQPMTSNTIRLHNQTYRPGDIRVKIKADYADLLGFGDGEVRFNSQIDYDPSTLPVIDFDNPIYVSADGNHKQYIGRTDGKGWDLVITGDGYLATDKALFDMHVKNALEAFLSYDNLLPHMALYNIHSVFVPSNERGADWTIEEGCHPVTFDNCQIATWAPSNNPEYKNDKDTVFDAGFYVGGAHSQARGLAVNDGLVKYHVETVVPQHDMILAMVNTNVYGGLGGNIPTANKMNPHVFVHELGHSFADLHDEYSDSGDIGPANFCDSNVCSDFNFVPWKHFLPGDVTIDTVCKETTASCPSGTAGWYEGGKYQPTGMWRSTDISIMRSNGYPFHAYNAERWANRLYQKAGYFSIISPQHASLNQSQMYVNFADQSNQVFAFNPSVEFHELNGSVERVQSFKWFINGVYQPQYDNAKTLQHGAYESGSYNVKLVAKDETGIIVIEEGTVSKFEWHVTNNSPYATATEYATTNEVKQVRAEVIVDQNGIRIEKVKPLSLETSLNDCSGKVFKGKTLTLSNDESRLTFCPYNVPYTHHRSALLEDKSTLDDSTYRFDIVLTEEMVDKTFTLEFSDNNQGRSLVSPVTVNFSQH
ncbi:M64 family metallopeptidase [Enterovibrio sp. ZSDZ35]|uniref:M64 family metallopeptidase n=1 Tax=Enterovibrio qingdaonensis TaxID=2899818 RepID=A0ABT5QG35_9GAMM|nr:M64 family metallopeptidase [Enterovibrio sp. ZSDZ35]MDD1779931.1 M64 family metallopeptidase [Enterovibrio sp. ZSDZ35]